MIIWLMVLCAALLAVILVLIVKIHMMRKSAEEIRLSFAEKLQSDTNTLVSVSASDQAMCRLANDLNTSLKELQKQRHRFVQGDLELKNAVANISHDLRTPLTAISGYLDLLDEAEKSEAADRYIQIIRSRTELLKQLTEELFRYSVITSPEYKDVMEALDVKAVLEESLLGFYAALRERSITPEIHMTEQRVTRNLSRAALSRVFSNLLNNAIKYSDGDLEITLTDQGEIIFSNMASGLSKVQTELLFDRFYTVETARKSTGLGLSIARILVEQMKGSISAEYKDGRLSICIRLPEE